LVEDRRSEPNQPLFAAPLGVGISPRSLAPKD